MADVREKHRKSIESTLAELNANKGQFPARVSTYGMTLDEEPPIRVPFRREGDSWILDTDINYID